MAARTADYYRNVKARPNKKNWFVNGDLVHIEHIQMSEGIVTLWNYNQDKKMIMTLQEFKRTRKRAYTVLETSMLLNYHRKSIPRLVKKGMLPRATGQRPGGETGWQTLSFYSEDQIFTARKLLAQQPQNGRVRKDGYTTNNLVPTEQELRVAMGDDMLVYIRDKDGNFIPIFAETV